MSDMIKQQMEVVIQKIADLFHNQSKNGLMLGSLANPDGTLAGIVIAVHCVDPEQNRIFKEQFARLIAHYGGSVVDGTPEKIEDEKNSWDRQWLN